MCYKDPSQPDASIWSMSYLREECSRDNLSTGNVGTVPCEELTPYLQLHQSPKASICNSAKHKVPFLLPPSSPIWSHHPNQDTKTDPSMLILHPSPPLWSALSGSDVKTSFCFQSSRLRTKGLDCAKRNNVNIKLF